MRPFPRVIYRALDFYRTGPDQPLLADAAAIDREYRKRRRLVFWSLVFGYCFYYVCRLTFSVAKKPLIDGGILDAAQMGKIGSALLLTYAFGKAANGFLGDRSNIRRFIATGLFGSAVITILFGLTRSFYLFLVLWAVNGWFQSMGSAPSGASISQWFSNKERGTRYGIWSTAHSLGEGATYLVTAVIIAAWGWQWGFWTAGLAGIAVALILFRTLADRPQTYGLPPVADYRNDHTEESRQAPVSVRQAQWEVIKNPFIWILALSCAAMYVARYGVNSWGVLYLQESKGYALVTAGSLLFAAKMAETLGALSSGFVSDFVFRARRNVVTLLYGLVEIAGLVILFAGPSTYVAALDKSCLPYLNEGAVESGLRTPLAQQGVAVPDPARVFLAKSRDAQMWFVQSNGLLASLRAVRIEETSTQLSVYRKYDFVHLAGLSLFGFGLGGLLVFLGGLIAIDICPKKASGAAMGFVGMFSYLGASMQDWTSGSLIEAGKMTVNGQTIHDFHHAFWFWLGAAILAVALSCTLWNAKARE